MGKKFPTLFPRCGKLPPLLSGDRLFSEKPEDILEIGQNVKVKVIKVDLKHKKIGLSIVKAVKEAEKAEYSSFINDKPELTLDLKEQLEGLNN